MTTALELLTEAATRQTRDSIEKRATARAIRVFRWQARALPAQSLAAEALRRFASPVAELREGPTEDELMGILAAVWPDGASRLAGIVQQARLQSVQLSGNLTLSAIGYRDSFSISDAVRDRIAAQALDQATGIDDFSRQRVRSVLARGIEDQLGARAIARQMRTEIQSWAQPGTQDGRRTAYRAQTIARTEVADAWGSTSREVLSRNGWTARVWLTAQDDRVDHGETGPCVLNGAAGPVPIDEPFPSGDMHEPAHPRCRCTTAPAEGYGPADAGDPWTGGD